MKELQIIDYTTLDKLTMSWIINRCINIKESLVSGDPFEEHEIRTKLNLGHTVGHAIEKLTHQIIHGKAVGFGLFVMIRFSMYVGSMTMNEAIRCVKLLNKYEVFNLHMYDDIAFEKSDKNGFDYILSESLKYISTDKKSINDSQINLVIPGSLKNNF